MGAVNSRHKGRGKAGAGPIIEIAPFVSAESLDSALAPFPDDFLRPRLLYLPTLTVLHLDFLDPFSLGELEVILGRALTLSTKKIDKIVLDGNNLDHIPSQIKHFTDLQTLFLKGNRLNTRAALEPLADLQFLSNELALCENNLSDLSLIPTLNNICSLRVGVNPIHNNQFQTLARFPSLRKLFLYEIPATNLVGFPLLPLLTNLDFDNAKLTSLRDLPLLPSVEWFHVRKNALKSLDGIEALPALKYLFINENEISSLEPLAELTNLEWIIAPSNQITSIEAVRGLTKMVDLTLSDNEDLLEVSPALGLQLIKFSLERTAATSDSKAALEHKANFKHVGSLNL